MGGNPQRQRFPQDHHIRRRIGAHPHLVTFLAWHSDLNALGDRVVNSAVRYIPGHDKAA